MALAWLLVALIEYFAWRQAPRYPTRYAAAGPAGMLDEEQVMVEEMTPIPPPPVAPPPEPAAPSPRPEEETVVASPDEPAPAAGSEGESISQADARVDAARLAFTEAERRTRHRLEPLQPRPRRRWGSFGRRSRPDESPSEEER